MNSKLKLPATEAEIKKALEAKALAMNSDPLVRSIRKVYRDSAQGKVDALLAEQTRWQRKRTIAENKLAQVRRDIDKALVELAKEKDGVKP